MVKYVIISGGVLSGLGKGVIASSTGLILRSYGFHVTSIKIDPYLNIDAGTMSPFEHGEVFILDDGGEVDLDLGNYERFVGLTLNRDNNITTGKIYKNVIEKERKGDYLGKTVQVVPHLCNEIQDWIEKVANTPSDGTNHTPDICVIELGGTVGDIESMPFVEALRQFQFRVGRDNICFIHVSLVPMLGVVGEHKTKPTQQSVRELRGLGVTPDLIICRSATPINDATKQKINMFCHVKSDCVLGVHDVSNLYRVPLLLMEQGLRSKILNTLNLYSKSDVPALIEWRQLADKVDSLSNSDKTVKIAMVGKYTGLSDSYLSVIKGLQHACIYIEEKLEILWIEASVLELESKECDPSGYEAAWKTLRLADGILVPGGFGDRAVEGKILAAEYARTHNIPYFGICLGLQIAVIEYAKNVLNWDDATSEEWDKDEGKDVIINMPEISKTHMGGTMRLGSRKTIFTKRDSLTAKLYKYITGHDTDFIYERHRHRYEVNPEYCAILVEKGLSLVGHDVTGKRQEIIEIENHPYFVAVQYHPEMKSRPLNPSPPFVGLVLAASGKLDSWLKKKEETFTASSTPSIYHRNPSPKKN